MRASVHLSKIQILTVPNIRHLFSLSLFFFLFPAFHALAQPQAGFDLGFADSVKSAVLKEQRPLLIYTPYSGKIRRRTTTETYPVIYVLDGESHFRSIAITVERLAALGLCPPMIVVGIPNVNRTRDLTPTAVVNNTDGVKNSGGGAQFISFIEKELIPYIDNNYPTASYKLLIGHSLGGLMVMQTMVHHKDLFKAYIAMDAAIWWDDHKILSEAKAANEKDQYAGKTLYLAIANRMERGVDTTAVQADTSEETELIRYNLDLIHHLKAHPQNGLRFKHAYYENETHGSVSFIAAYDALRFIFDYYAFPRYAEYQITNPNLPSVITAHYTKITRELGYQVLPDPSLVNNLGYYALRSNKYEIAGQLFALNVRNFPEDANLHDSYGDYYLAIGDKKKAADCFKRALSIADIPETRSKLNELLKKK